MSTETEWTFEQLVEHLRSSCEVKPGDIMVIHSSAGAVGKVAGGVITMLKAIKEAVTPEGTILMPVFSSPREDHIFKMARTPSRVGLLTEALRRNKEAVRSRHPTHSFSAWGRRAVELTANHDKTSAVGIGSPLHLAADAGADVMMIGCTLTTCTLVHLGEAMIRVPYLGKVSYPGYDTTLTLVDTDGSTQEFRLYDNPGDGSGFGAVQTEMEKRGQIRTGKFGDAAVLRFSAKDCLAATIDLLRADPAAMLCSRPRCTVCQTSRQIAEEAVKAGQWPPKGF